MISPLLQPAFLLQDIKTIKHIHRVVFYILYNATLNSRPFMVQRLQGGMCEELNFSRLHRPFNPLLHF